LNQSCHSFQRKNHQLGLVKRVKNHSWAKSRKSGSVKLFYCPFLNKFIDKKSFYKFFSQKSFVEIDYYWKKLYFTRFGWKIDLFFLLFPYKQKIVALHRSIERKSLRTKILITFFLNSKYQSSEQKDVSENFWRWVRGWLGKWRGIF